MEFQVKAIDGNVEEKSKAQVEETLLKEHEEQYEDSSNKDDSIARIDLRTSGKSTTEESSVDETKQKDGIAGEARTDLQENDILSYIFHLLLLRLCPNELLL